MSSLSKLEEYLLNPQARVDSGPVPERSWNIYREDHRTIEDCPQNDPHRELSFSQSLSSQKFSPKEMFHIVTGVQEEI